MEIHIHRKNYNDLLQQNKIRWSLLTRNNIITFITFIGIGFMFLVPTTVNVKDAETFWSNVRPLALSLILLCIFYFFLRIRDRQRFFLRTKELISRSNKQTTGIDITVTDTGVTYNDFEMFHENKWTIYSHYKFYKDHLLLLSFNEYLSGLIINKNEMTPEQFTELTNFVKKRLQERK